MPCSALFLCHELLCPSFIVMNSRRRLVEVMCERSLPLLTLCSVVAARCARRSDLHGRHANDFDMVEGANDDNESSTNLSLSLLQCCPLLAHSKEIPFSKSKTYNMANGSWDDHINSSGSSIVYVWFVHNYFTSVRFQLYWFQFFTKTCSRTFFLLLHTKFTWKQM